VSDKAFTVEIDLPGVGKGDITIDLTGRRLMVHGSRTPKEHHEVDAPLNAADGLLQVRGRPASSSRGADRHCRPIRMPRPAASCRSADKRTFS